MEEMIKAAEEANIAALASPVHDFKEIVKGMIEPLQGRTMTMVIPLKVLVMKKVLLLQELG